jgi:sigma-B regulation protein RsbU (phosphoserine phosphatase)
MSAQNEVAALRGELTDIISGAFFMVVGLMAFSIAAIRRRSATRILIWLGLLSTMFGANLHVQSASVAAVLPPAFASVRPYLINAISYLTLVVGALVFRELTAGGLRRLFNVWLVGAIAIAVAGIGWFLISGAGDTFIVYNQLLAAVGLAIMIVALSVPKLSQRYLVLGRHRVLTVGMLIFGAEALYANIARPLNYPVPSFITSLGFAVLLLSFGYTALEMIVSNERRLLSIDKELEIARQLQFSILPANVPQVPNLRIAASYLPMTAVAGDFYQFVRIDQRQVGFLVADVSGHGVPAALIASMIKVAMHSADGCAHDPSEVLRCLGNTLAGELRGQFVSAAYLWIDSQTRSARYSAAGHPPLLHWSAAEGALVRIESNGLLFGVPVNGDYPACKIPLARGDRLILYTDGFTEPENAAGEPFGDRKLEEVVRDNQSLPALELSDCLLAELRAWQPTGLTQQDDITLIVIDVM